MTVELPGSSRLHVWLGLLIALVGVIVGGYAYTGDRIYEIVYIGVAFLGFLLMVGGSMLAAWGQANRPRLGGNPVTSDDDPPLTQRLAAILPWRDGDEEEVEPVSVTLSCPDCGTVFDTEGQPPFTAVCPNCEHEDTVELPDAAA